MGSDESGGAGDEDGDSVAGSDSCGCTDAFLPGGSAPGARTERSASAIGGGRGR